MTDPVFVWGTGPIPAPSGVMCVGEAWGEKEERAGTPFCGSSGEELDRYLSSIRIPRETVYVTNMVNERPFNNADPTPELIERHRERLCQELLMVRPRYVVTLGRFALQWFLGDSAKLDREWGIPHTLWLCNRHGRPRCDFCGYIGLLADSETDQRERDWWSTCVIPSHHPAYGLYMPDDQVLIQEAFEGRMGLTWGLARVMRGELAPHPPQDEYPNPAYVEITDPEMVTEYLGEPRVCAIDTEGSVAHPWCLTVSTEPGTAYLIAAANVECVRAFAAWLDRVKPIVVCHYLAHDMEVLAAMDVDISMCQHADTMLIDYELGPMFAQALKVSGYRLLGVHMRDYGDLMAGADRELAMEYLELVLASARCRTCRGRGIVVAPYKRLKNGKVRWPAATKCNTCEGDGTSWPKPDALALWDNGKLTSWQPSPVGKRERRILDDVRSGKINRDGELTDPRERWENADPPEAIAAVVAVLGHMPQATLDMVPRDEVVAYSCCDADVTLRKWLLLDPMIDTWGLRETYNTDLAIIPLLVEMQQTGVEVDTEHFARLSREWRSEMAQVRHRLQKLVGYYVNPASSKQVANLLFERLKLPPVKLTKSKLGESTDDKVLEQLRLATDHPVIPLVQRHRELDKLDGTYATPLSHVTSADRRVRMEMKYTRTGTGRISSSKPRRGRDKNNWIQGQNIPTRGDEGKRIREGFVAREGYLLGEWDLAQIEWKIMAHLSQDENLLRTFRSNLDLHKMTAALIYHVPIESVSKEQRDRSKNIGFGMGYKISWRGLQQQFAVRGIRLTRDEAQAFIDAFMAAYPGIPRFWESVFMEARRNGFVRSADGRIRWATAARCTASWVRESAERELGNHPVQGLAAWTLKRIMIEADRRVIKPLRRTGFDVKMWLTVHDSLALEFPEGVESLLDPMMRKVMSETVRLSVPVSGEGKWGARWSDCKD